MRNDIKTWPKIKRTNVSSARHDFCSNKRKTNKMVVLSPGKKEYECDICECKFEITSPRDTEMVDMPDKSAFWPQMMRKMAIVTYCPQCNREIFIKWV